MTATDIATGVLWYLAIATPLVALNHLIRPRRDRLHLGPGERTVTETLGRLARP